METVVIVIHLMVIVALVAVVLMQRSEGGALGIGGSNNFLSTRSQANVLTRSTAILAAAFFATSIALTLIGRFQEKPSSIIEQATQPPATAAPATAGGATGSGGAPATGNGGDGSLLNQLQGISKPATPAAPGAPAAPAAPAAPQVPSSQ